MQEIDMSSGKRACEAEREGVIRVMRDPHLNPVLRSDVRSECSKTMTARRVYGVPHGHQPALP